MRREGIDQPAGFERLDAMHEARRHDEGAALFDDLGVAVDRHFEPAVGHLARLDVRVRMQRADTAFLEAELDHHQLVRVQEDAAAVAV